MLRWSAEISINQSNPSSFLKYSFTTRRSTFGLLFILIALFQQPAKAGAADGVDIVGETQIASTTRVITGEATGKSVQAARVGKEFHIVMTGLPTDQTVQIELGFAELEKTKTGAREFNVYVNEKRALSSFDIFKEAGGPLKSVVKKFTITPNRGFLDFHFVGTTGDAAVNYIRVTGDGIDRLVTAPVTITPGGSPDEDVVPADQQASFDVETGSVSLDGSAETWNSGVPIGGIGTGKFAILPNGQFANVTINNSWDLPVLRPQGTFLAIAAKARSGSGVARIMQVNPSGTSEKAAFKNHPAYKEVEFTGSFPFARWEFSDKDMYVDAKVEAWSPVSPGNIEDSSLPGGIVSVTLTNSKSYPVSVGVALSWEDLNGRGGSLLPGDQHGFIGRSTHQDAATSTVTGFQITNDFNQQIRQATFTGDYFVGTPIKGASITRKLNWNPRTGSIPWWKTFARELRLDRIPAAPATVTGDPKAGPAASTICVSFNLAPKEVRRVPFIISWYMPEIITLDSADGTPAKEVPNYADRFGSSAGVASYIASKRFEMRQATDEWYEMVDRSSIPQWLKTHTLNSLFPIKSNTVLLKNQRFAMLEAPADMKGMLGPVDLRLAAGDFLRTMYPELEKGELRLYARAQDTATGRIPRYIGNIHGALAGFDPTLLGNDWVDPTACWVLQVAAYWRETGDRDFLNEIKPAMVKARDFLKQQLESGQVADSTNAFTSTNSFTGAGEMTFLNTITALKATPILLQEPATSTEAFVQPFVMGLSQETTSTFAALLSAEYAARQAALPSPLQPDQITKFLETLQANNFADSKPVPLMEVNTAGADTSEKFSFPAPLQTYTGAVGLAAGLAEIGLEPYVRMFQVAYAAQKAPWKQALRYEVPTAARSQIRYHRSAMAAWTLWRGMSGVVHDVPAKRLLLKPQTIGAPDSEMEVPVFTPAFWGWLKYHQNDSTGTLAITRVNPDFTSSTITSIASTITQDGTPQNLVTFAEPFMLEEGATLQLDGWPRKSDGTVTPQKPALPEPIDAITTESLSLEDFETTGSGESTTSLEAKYGGEDVPLTEEEKESDENPEAKADDTIPEDSSEGED